MHTHFKKASLNHLKPGSRQAIEDDLIGEIHGGIGVIWIFLKCFLNISFISKKVNLLVLPLMDSYVVHKPKDSSVVVFCCF